MRKIRTLLAAAILLGAVGANAEVVTYVLQTPGVLWGSTSARAREAVEKIENVESVTTDMTANTVTVTFDDEKVELTAIVLALNDAGYVVKDKDKVE